MINEAIEREEFEKYAKRVNLNTCRNANKRDEYAFHGTQKAWMAWMLSAKRHELPSATYASTEGCSDPNSLYMVKAGFNTPEAAHKLMNLLMPMK